MGRAAAALLVALVGCNAVLGVEELPSANPAPVEVKVVFTEPQCATCNAEKCGPERAKCDADHGCRPLHACLASCRLNDVKCRTACETAAPLAVVASPFVELDRCVRRDCTDACLGVTGIGAAYGP